MNCILQCLNHLSCSCVSFAIRLPSASKRLLLVRTLGASQRPYYFELLIATTSCLQLQSPRLLSASVGTLFDLSSLSHRRCCNHQPHKVQFAVRAKQRAQAALQVCSMSERNCEARRQLREVRGHLAQLPQLICLSLCSSPQQ